MRYLPTILCSASFCLLPTAEEQQLIVKEAAVQQGLSETIEDLRLSSSFTLSEPAVIPASTTVTWLGRKAELISSAKQEWLATLRSEDVATWVIDGAPVLFNGYWQGASTGRSKNNMVLRNGGHLTIGPDAVLNQQLFHGVNARVFRASGDGSNTTLELHPDFKADHMGFPAIDTWHSRGFSVLFYENTTLISHATASLPSVHKRAGNGNHTHHGVITMGGDATWRIATDTQYYDGVINWRGANTIDTQTDLVFTGHYFDDSHCFFGASQKKNDPATPRLIKQGDATLAIMGTQWYSIPATIAVEAGRLALLTNPADPGYKIRGDSDPATWDRNLTVTVTPDGTLQCSGVATYDIAGLTNAGQLIVHGQIRSTGAITLKDTSRVTLNLQKATGMLGHNRQKGPSNLFSDTAIHLAGDLHITQPQAGTFTLLQAPKLTGDLMLQVPDGWAGTLTDGQLTLTQVEAIDDN